MGEKPLPENDQKKGGKHANEPVTIQPEQLPLVDAGGVCKECLNEDFDSCVCPEPKK